MQNTIRNSFGTWIGKRRGSRAPQDASRRPKTPRGLQVGADLAPRGVPKSIKNRSKFDLGRSRAPRPPQDPSKPENREQFQHPTGHHFGRILEPCWPPRATKRTLKKHTKFSLIWKSLFHRFFIHFGRVLGGSWTQVGLQNPLKITSRC